MGLTMVEVGVKHRPRVFGQSKVSLLDVPRTLRTLIPFWWSHVVFGKTPLAENVYAAERKEVARNGVM